MTTAAARVVGRFVEASMDRSASVKKPLYGHTSEATAYLVDDYPYGYNQRTQIRYWLEYKPKKGWRFVSQTLNPKTQRWNKPKASTYMEWGAAMYLDEKDHVTWSAVGQYSDAKKIAEFVSDFPRADFEILRYVAKAKIKFLEKMITGEVGFSINDVRQELSEADIGRYRAEIEEWKDILPKL